MRKKRLIVAIAVALMIAGLAVVVSLRRQAGPEAARLLPDGGAIVYADIGRIRTIAKLGELGGGLANRSSAASSAISIDEPEYHRFVDETGFQFERDLDEVAMAVHPLRVQSAAGPGKGSQPVAALEYRFSEVFVGHFDSQRLAAYLKKISGGVERYDNSDVFVIPHEGRTVRVAILRVGMVAASNVEDAGVIRGMLDRFHHAALPVEEPSLLRRYRSFLPSGSVLWAIIQAAPAAERGGDPGVRLPSPAREWAAGSIVVASITLSTALQLKAEVFTSNAETAKGIVDTATTYLNLYRTMETSAAGADPDVKTLFQSIRVEQVSERVVVSASLTPAFLQKMTRDTQPQIPAQPQSVPAGNQSHSRDSAASSSTKPDQHTIPRARK